MTIRNFTPHVVRVVDEEGSLVREFPSNGLARVASSEVIVEEFDGIQLSKTHFGDVEGLPDAEDGTLLIVSRLVKAAMPERADLVCPGMQVRDDEGRVIGCKSLALS